MESEELSAEKSYYQENEKTANRMADNIYVTYLIMDVFPECIKNSYN
jgi:hypothetical protein